MRQALVNMLNRPESVWTAGAVGVLAGVSVLVTVGVASLQSKAQPIRMDERVGATASESAPVLAPAHTFAEPAPHPSNQIRVRVLAGVTGLQAEAPSGLRVAQASAADLVNLPPQTGREPVLAGPVAVTLSAGGWLVTTRGAPDAGVQFPAGGRLVLSPARAGEAITINGKSYPGRIRLSVRGDMGSTTFDAVEFVGIEDYLPGVVAKEMFAGWPLEAYRVQAVCARSYALQERERSLGAGQAFDVENGEQDQAYLGVTENRQAITAVQSTRGMVLMWRGRVLRAYYSSTCGGRFASARDTWPTGPGYEFNLADPIQASAREYSCDPAPLFRWEVHRTRRDLAARLRAFGERQQIMVRQLRGLHAVEAVEHNSTGRPSRFRIVEPGGRWFSLSGEELRLACNTPAGPGFDSIDRRSRVSSSDIDVRVRGEEVVIVGRGFGHGVGMCQYCAKGFAERGEDWRSMLARFYPGATIEKRW